MYFKRLEIFGFKSFAEKTVLNFEPGITAIVGPNGCGKSNVFDAIRWVLGEQSVKELRGSSMEDVIFNGTDKKAALGFAEVSLTFSNESRALPIEYDEVTVTRRLFRSGESQYLINKTVVRLRDIAELFMGTGIGAEAYSLVQQGKVDLVVSAKPEDRRVIFDEASGITKYKSKKKEALSKLKETEENLLRVNDIVVEVKRQIGTIERQAKKAQRYKEEFDQLKGLETIFAQYQLHKFQEELRTIETESAQLQEKGNDLHRQLEEFNNLIEHETFQLEEIDEKINELRAQEMRIENDIELQTRQIGFNTERIESLDASVVRIEQQKKQLEEKSAVHRQKIEELNRLIEGLKESLQISQTALGDRKQALNQILEDIERAKNDIHAAEQHIFGLTSRQVQIKNGLTEIMKEVQGALARKRRLEHENSKVNSEQIQVNVKFEDLTQKIEQTLQGVDRFQQQIASQKQALDLQNEELSVLNSAILDLEKKKLFLISQKEFTEKLQVQYQDNPDPTVEGRFLSSVSPLERQGGIIGKVKSVIPVDAERLAQLKIQFPNFNVEQMYEIICEAKFIEADPHDIKEKIDAIDAELAQREEQKRALIESIQQALMALEQTQRFLQDQEKSLSALEAQKNTIIEESGKLLGEIDLINSEMKEVETALYQLNNRETELGQQLDQLNNELIASQAQIRTQQESIAQKSQSREDALVAIAQTESELQSLQDKEQGLLDNLQLFTESLEVDQEEIRRLDHEVTGFDAKRVKLNEEIELSAAAIEDLKEKKNGLRSSFSETEAQKAEINQRLNSVKSNINAIVDEIDNVKNRLHEQQFKNQEILFGQKSLKERLWQAYKIEVTDNGRIRIPAPVAAQPEPAESAAADENAEAQPAEQTVEASPETPAEAAETIQTVEPEPETGSEPQPLPEINIEELTAQIEHLKKRCEAYGAVNLVAIEEFEQLKERFEFLTKQQSDLLTAREALMQTISKINKTTKQLFLDTFVKVNEEFRVYYRMLFGGGEAQLILLDPDNALESGIDIVARPPGKKLQNISLLSGGEKTLTAIALIFGVFKVNPSPFCVLDEIDAALDESNVGRFAYLLKEFAKIAQFIVITHNKKTISSADIMYGVTMQQTGVSRIVSAKLSQKEDAEVPPPAAEPAAIASSA